MASDGAIHKRSLFDMRRSRTRPVSHEKTAEHGMCFCSLVVLVPKYLHEQHPTFCTSSSLIILRDLSLCLRLVHHRVLLAEVETNTVDAVSLISRCRVPFALEDVAKVASAVTADDLYPLHAERSIAVSRDCARHSIEECWPSAATLELLLRGV